VFVLAGLFVFVFLVVKWKSRSRRKAMLRAPLAGLDTGVRSAYRVPGRGQRMGF
jgi:hypothetical protein